MLASDPGFPPPARLAISGSPDSQAERRISMVEPNTITLSDSDRGLRAAIALLRAGEVVAFPTETVYGLGADACDVRAVAGIFAAKGRPAYNPLIVHVADRAAAERLADFTPAARALADRFWPGPLTLVLPRRAEAGLAPAVSAGLATVALRVPAHPLARRLLDGFTGPLAAPSANPSGAVSPTTAAHVRDGLGGRIAAILDGGACEVGLESTIIGFENGTPVLLRPGGLPVETLEAALGRPLAAPAGAGVTAPGQLASHYAPRARLRLDAAEAGPGELRLGFGPGDGDDLNLSRSGDLAEAAANLFAHLRAADVLAAARHACAIAVAPIPRDGLGAAINDRLARAAAPRE
jgi:L-threonylcarbamoyladenylate synthase